MSLESRKVPFYIEQFEHGSLSWEEQEKAGINHTLYIAYKISKQMGHDIINFHDVICVEDIETIVNTLKKNRIRTFTISGHFSWLFDCLVEFEKFGCRVNGLTEIRDTGRNLDGTLKKASALEVEILN